MATPKATAEIINNTFWSPVTLNDSFTSMVEMTKPELRITLLNLSVCAKENSTSNTSTKIRTVKKSSKKMALTSKPEVNPCPNADI